MPVRQHTCFVFFFGRWGLVSIHRIKRTQQYVRAPGDNKRFFFLRGDPGLYMKIVLRFVKNKQEAFYDRGTSYHTSKGKKKVVGTTTASSPGSTLKG